MNKKMNLVLQSFFIAVALVLVIGIFTETNKVAAAIDKHEESYYYGSEEGYDVFKAFRFNDEDLLKTSLQDESKDIDCLIKYKYTYEVIKESDKFKRNSNSKFNNNKNYLLSIYNIEDSNYVIAYRSNYKMNFESLFSMSAKQAVFDIDESKLIGDEILEIEFIIDASNFNKIPEGSDIFNIDIDSYEYKKFIHTVKSERVRNLSNEIRSGLHESKQDDISAIAYANIDWILDNLHYVTDYKKTVTVYNNLRNPEKVLENGFGVCDDYTDLLKQLFDVQGIPSRIMICSYPSSNPKRIDHSLLEVFDGKEWFIVDATLYNLSDSKIIELDDGNELMVSNSFAREDFANAVWMPFFTLNGPDRIDYEFYEGVSLLRRDYEVYGGKRFIEIDENN